LVASLDPNEGGAPRPHLVVGVQAVGNQLEQGAGDSLDGGAAGDGEIAAGESEGHLREADSCDVFALCLPRRQFDLTTISNVRILISTCFKAISYFLS